MEQHRPFAHLLHRFSSPLRKAFQETQHSFQNFGSEVHNSFQKFGSKLLDPKPRPASQQQLEAVVAAPTSVEHTLNRQLEAWNRNSDWTDEPPTMKVSVPKGTLCHLDTSFQLGLPPDALFNIITDPGNDRVFKNIKEITYRKVIEDEGHRQLVEVEHAAIWRFLCFSGTLSIRVFVDQNRDTHSVRFYLAREGFMKKFEGIWNVKPLYVDSPHCATVPSPEDDPACRSSRVASEVHLKQIVQPALVPPPPISWYIRGISSKQTEVLIEYLQAEAKRQREGKLEEDNPEQGQNGLSTQIRQVEHTNQGEHFSRFRRPRKSSWRLKKPVKPLEASR